MNNLLKKDYIHFSEQLNHLINYINDNDKSEKTLNNIKNQLEELKNYYLNLDSYETIDDLLLNTLIIRKNFVNYLQTQTQKTYTKLQDLFKTWSYFNSNLQYADDIFNEVIKNNSDFPNFEYLNNNLEEIIEKYYTLHDINDNKKIYLCDNLFKLEFSTKEKIVEVYCNENYIMTYNKNQINELNNFLYSIKKK